MRSRIGDPLPRRIVVPIWVYIGAGFGVVSSVTAALGIHPWTMPIVSFCAAMALLLLCFVGPRSREIVEVDEQGVAVQTKSGIERITWPEVERVRILTTGGGPSVEDVYFLLEGEGKGCAVPHDAAVRVDLLKELQSRLPGIRDDEIIKAMGSTSDNSFTIWEAPRVGAV